MISPSKTRSRSLSTLLRSLRTKASISLSESLKEVPVREVSTAPKMDSSLHEEFISQEATGWYTPAKHDVQPLLMGDEIRITDGKYCWNHKSPRRSWQSDRNMSIPNTLQLEDTTATSSSALFACQLTASPSSRNQRRQAHVFSKISIQTGDFEQDVFIYADSPQGSIMSFESESTEESCEELESITFQSTVLTSTTRASLTLRDICLPSSTSSRPAANFAFSAVSPKTVEETRGPPAAVFAALEDLRCLHDEYFLDSRMEDWDDLDSPTEPFFDLGGHHHGNQEDPGEAVGIAL